MIERRGGKSIAERMRAKAQVVFTALKSNSTPEPFSTASEIDQRKLEALAPIRREVPPSDVDVILGHDTFRYRVESTGEEYPSLAEERERARLQKAAFEVFLEGK
jgi:hypothetical protein